METDIIRTQIIEILKETEDLELLYLILSLL